MIAALALAMLAGAAGGCAQMRTLPSDGSDPAVNYLRADLDDLHEKVSEQVDANTRFGMRIAEIDQRIDAEAGRINRTDERVTNAFIDIGEIRTRMEILEGAKDVSRRALVYLESPLEFEFDKAELLKPARRRVLVAAQLLEADPGVRVVVVGTLPPECVTIDECGDDPLVQQRAKTVLERLEKAGIETSERVDEEYVQGREGASAAEQSEVRLSFRLPGGRPPAEEAEPTPPPAGDTAEGAATPPPADGTPP